MIFFDFCVKLYPGESESGSNFNTGYILMNKTGIVSISFRKYTKEEIVSYVSAAGLDSIEWGGDVHTPHGDVAEAKKTVEITHGCGLEVAEYGSYYVIGQSEESLFGEVLASAEVLGTKMIRVWPGMNKSSDTFTTEEYRKAAKIPHSKHAYMALAALANIGIIEEAEKKGRARAWKLK